MSFRKKNISILPTRGAPISSSKAPETESSPGITSTSGTASSTTPVSNPVTAPTARSVPGVRPSPISGHPITSTGTPSLDALLSGHAGLPLGSSLLVEESGTTDFGGALLRYYASEGIVQRHHVIVVGMGEHWARELPAAVGSAGADEQKEGEVKKERERMKIAWRYERLAAGGSGGGVAAGLGSKRGIQPQQQEGLPGVHSGNNTHGGLPSATAATDQQGPFCHSFDLTKRLEILPETKISYIPLTPSLPLVSNSNSPFIDVLSRLSSILKTSPPGTIHRLVIPNLLSPALYPPHACLPNHLIQFMHSLRALLRVYYTSLTAMISFPLELYPRTIGLVRWVEILTDAVVELVPVASLMERAAQAAAKGREDVPMGLVRVWKVPEKRLGMGASAGVGEDLAFTVTRRRFGIGLFSLPPAEEGDEDKPGALGKDEGEGGGGKTKTDIDF